MKKGDNTKKKLEQRAIEKLAKILKMEEAELLEYAEGELTKNGFTVEVDGFGNLIARKESGLGNPVLLTAHYDTVFEEPPFHVVRFMDNLIGLDSSLIQCGLGGDDRAGVFIILELSRIVDNCVIAFFADEEVGCVGSNCVDMKHFEDCGVAFALDRHVGHSGKNEAVTYTNGIIIASKEFTDFIAGIAKSYKYEFCNGLHTDIGELKKRGLNVSALNITCGFMREHTESELIDLNRVANARDFVFDLIELCSGGRFEHVADKPKSILSKDSGFGTDFYIGGKTYNIGRPRPRSQKRYPFEFGAGNPAKGDLYPNPDSPDYDIYTDPKIQGKTPDFDPGFPEYLEDPEDYGSYEDPEFAGHGKEESEEERIDRIMAEWEAEEKSKIELAERAAKKYYLKNPILPVNPKK